MVVHILGLSEKMVYSRSNNHASVSQNFDEVINKLILTYTNVLLQGLFLFVRSHKVE